VQQILKELKDDKIPDNDPQMVQAKDLADRIQMQFHSAARETFSQLWYPIRQGGADLLINADIQMKFEANKYNGEQQVLALLRDKKKFEEDISSDTFRAKCEARLFTVQSLPWNEIKRRAAINVQWQWHHPDALDELKSACLHKDSWREEGGFVDKGPFPQPETDVLVKEVHRDAETGEVTLQITPVHGDTVYYDVGADASTASARLEGNTLVIKDMHVSFLAVDSKGQHDPGAAKPWANKITLKHRIYQSGDDKCMELRAIPDATIYYTTNGSNPKVAGARYNGDFVIPYGAPMALAYAVQDGIESPVEQIAVSWDKSKAVQIDEARSAMWKHNHGYNSTKQSYEFLARLKKYGAQATGVNISILGEGGDKGWVELSTAEEKRLTPEQVEECLEVLRKVQGSGQVQLAAQALHFAAGLDLLAWVEDAKITLKPDEVKQ